MKGGMKEFCTVPDCARPRVGWGLCSLHYERSRRNGSPEETLLTAARAERAVTGGARKCYQCGERKPFTAEFFPRSKQAKAGLKGTCRKCARTAVRGSELKRAYGLSREQHTRMQQRQDGRCLICAVKFFSGGGGTRPHVDHRHDSGAVRGLLCHNCNVLLGHAKESPGVLRAAAEYLEKANADSD